MVKLISIIRVILFMPKPRVGEAEAMEIARREFSIHGHEMKNPMVIERLRYWEIFADWYSGSFARIVIDQRDGTCFFREGSPR